jgi:hypothetical protein
MAALADVPAAASDRSGREKASSENNSTILKLRGKVPNTREDVLYKVVGERLWNRFNRLRDGREEA